LRLSRITIGAINVGQSLSAHGMNLHKTQIVFVRMRMASTGAPPSGKKSSFFFRVGPSPRGARQFKISIAHQ
jgi:hypothetical protein